MVFRSKSTKSNNKKRAKMLVKMLRRDRNRIESESSETSSVSKDTAVDSDSECQPKRVRFNQTAYVVEVPVDMTEEEKTNTYFSASDIAAFVYNAKSCAAISIAEADIKHKRRICTRGLERALAQRRAEMKEEKYVSVANEAIQATIRAQSMHVAPGTDKAEFIATVYKSVSRDRTQCALELAKKDERDAKRYLTRI